MQYGDETICISLKELTTCTKIPKLVKAFRRNLDVCIQLKLGHLKKIDSVKAENPKNLHNIQLILTSNI